MDAAENDAAAIVERARAGAAPSEWNVWGLRREWARTSALKWGALGVVGFVFLALAARAMIPEDFSGAGAAQQSVAALALALLGALAFGAAGIAIYDLWRLAHARDYWLIITPTTFVKAAPRKLTSTPLEYVTGLTLKGVALPGEGVSANDAPVATGIFGARMMTFANSAGVPVGGRQRARGAPSLAYRDARDNKVVVVCMDEAFDHMGAIYELLRDRAALREDQVRRALYQGRLR